MALADRKQLLIRKPAFEVWLENLSDRNRTVVVGWLEDPSIPNQRVADWIREDDADDDFKGYPAGKDTIANARSRRGIVRTA